MSRTLFSSASDRWATPRALREALELEFRFTLDPCPLWELGEERIDGLIRPWTGERVYCNPPYGREIGLWLERALEAELAVYLLPARTDTEWFHRYCLEASELRFLKGRLIFGSARFNAPFPSMLAIWRNT